MSTFDLTQYRVVTAQDVDAATQKGAKELLVQERAIITGAARDMITARGLTTRTPGSPSQAVNTGSEWDKLFFSPEAEAVKKEICDVGRKLWQRQYVDGNGGNISYRIAENAVICTPTLLQQGRFEARRHVHGGSAGQSACGQARTHQRNPAAPGNLQGSAARRNRACIVIRRMPPRTPSRAACHRHA